MSKSRPAYLAGLVLVFTLILIKIFLQSGSIFGRTVQSTNPTQTQPVKQQSLNPTGCRDYASLQLNIEGAELLLIKDGNGEKSGYDPHEGKIVGNENVIYNNLHIDSPNEPVKNRKVNRALFISQNAWGVYTLEIVGRSSQSGQIIGPDFTVEIIGMGPCFKKSRASISGEISRNATKVYRLEFAPEQYIRVF